MPTLLLHNLNLSAQGSEGGIGAQGIEVCPSEVGWTLCGQHLQINTFIQIESEGGGEGGIMYNIVKDSVVSLSCDGLEDLQSSFDTVTDTQVDQPVKPSREAEVVA